MKTVILMLALTANAHAAGDNLMGSFTGTDKVAHAGVSAGLMVAGALTAQSCGSGRGWSLAYGSATSLGLGLYKEYGLDKKPDPLDIVADGLGIGSAVALMGWIFWLEDRRQQRVRAEVKTTALGTSLLTLTVAL